MTTLYVQFSDATETAIISWFAGPQDPKGFSNLGQVAASDSRYHTFYSQCNPGGAPPYGGMPVPE